MALTPRSTPGQCSDGPVGGRAANDAAVELNKLGYWTDNGAAYYYYYDPTINSYTARCGPFAISSPARSPLGYLQLGQFAVCEKFAGHLARLGRQLSRRHLSVSGGAGLVSVRSGFVPSSNWECRSSPMRGGWIRRVLYKSNYLFSANVSIDPNYWSNVLDYIASAGAVSYEQDWLGDWALPW